MMTKRDVILRGCYFCEKYRYSCNTIVSETLFKTYILK